jgi:hypothetical protein
MVTKRALVTVSVAGLLLACSHSMDAGAQPRKEAVMPDTTPNTTQHPADLILKISAEPKAEVGYGTVFVCQVQKVIQGQLATNLIRMTVLASDKTNRDFFAAHAAPATVEVGFKKANENEPYDMMPITGFVDERKTSWLLVYAK